VALPLYISDGPRRQVKTSKEDEVMREPAKNPFDLLLDQIRVVVREEIKAALTNGKQPAADKEWMKAKELAELYGLPRTWFEERGRAGEIARPKPGRYVLFKRRDVEAFLEKNKRGVDTKPA
jgi:excisionase family DNA binding protein